MSSLSLSLSPSLPPSLSFYLSISFRHFLVPSTYLSASEIKQLMCSFCFRFQVWTLAGPYFDESDPRVRLDASDALFVDVIHTDTDPLYKLGKEHYFVLTLNVQRNFVLTGMYKI